MTAHQTDNLDSVVELASEFSSTSSPTSTWSISTENGNKYNNQLHYYEEHGWPEGWGTNTLPQTAELRATSEPARLVASGDGQPTVGDLSQGDAGVSPTSYRPAISLIRELIYLNQSREYEDKGVQATLEHFTPAQVPTCSCQPPQVPELAVNYHAVNVAEDTKGIMKIEGGGVRQRKKRGLDIRNDGGDGVLDKENILPRASHSAGKRAADTSLEGSKKRRKEEED